MQPERQASWPGQCSCVAFGAFLFCFVMARRVPCILQYVGVYLFAMCCLVIRSVRRLLSLVEHMYLLVSTTFALYVVIKVDRAPVSAGNTNTVGFVNILTGDVMCFLNAFLRQSCLICLLDCGATNINHLFFHALLGHVRRRIWAVGKKKGPGKMILPASCMRIGMSQ
jgi:hypothetical protein